MIRESINGLKYGVSWIPQKAAGLGMQPHDIAGE